MSAAPKVIRYKFGGALGNRMFEAMLAHSLADRIPGLAVTGPRLAEWGLRPPPLDLPPRHLKLLGHKVDVARLAYLLREDLIDGIETMALGCRMELLPPLALAERLFPPREDGVATGDDALLIDIRAAEILGPAHPAYRPLPIAFYERVASETGLRPVFSGQVADDPYSEALRARFPRADVLPNRGPMWNFANIRRARHICVPISTFSWLASWLSEAATIHLPVIGFYHPGFRPDVDLLPLGDPRYRFHLFPAGAWGGTAAELDAAIHGDEAGRELTREEVLRLAQPGLAPPQAP